MLLSICSTTIQAQRSDKTQPQGISSEGVCAQAAGLQKGLNIRKVLGVKLRISLEQLVNLEGTAGDVLLQRIFALLLL